MNSHTESYRARRIAASGLAIAIAFATLSMSVAARMYQWSSGVNGTVQLSGTAPGWYRQPGAGPRVLVFENGRLIDDTAIRVSETQRRRLRASALGAEAATVRAQARDHAAESADEAPEAVAEKHVDGAATSTPSGDQPAGKPGTGPVEQTVAELKLLLDAWDSRRLNEAKQLLRDAAAGATAPLLEQAP